MEKDAYYFPHFCNARNDRKLKRVRKELGLEGYGIYFMILETLREQPGFKFPMEDIDLLADEFGTSESKLRTVVCNYKLFNVDEGKNFFSMKFIEYLKPYLDGKQRRKVGGVKGNLIKYGYASKEDLDKLSDLQILELNENKHLLEVSVSESVSESESDRNASQSKVKESKVKESKVNNNKDVYDTSVIISALQSKNLKIKIEDILKIYDNDIQGTVQRIEAYYKKGESYVITAIRDKYDVPKKKEKNYMN